MKNLLVISSRYPHAHDSASHVFVKSQVDELKQYFDRVVVIAATPYVPKILAGTIAKKREGDSLAEDYSYDNVEVKFIKDLVLPGKGFTQSRMKKASQKAMELLDELYFKPDIIHAHFILPSGYIAKNIGDKLGVQYTITAHGYDVYDLPFRTKDLKDTSMICLQRAARVITVSKNNQDILTSKLQTPVSKITVIPNGFNHEMFKPMDSDWAREHLGLPKDKKICLAVGNSQYMNTKDGKIEVKGHKYFSKSAELLEDDALLFVIVGKIDDGVLIDSVRKKFLLPGQKPHSEIPIWMSACDIFVMPSLFEGVPTVLFEALGCGKPVVGTRVGGISDIIKNEDVGLLVEPGDENALAEAIGTALEKDWEPGKILQYSRQFTWKRLSHQIYKEMEKAINTDSTNTHAKTGGR